MEPKDCPHLDFEAQVAVNRIEDNATFCAEVAIKCKHCKTLFKFLGLPHGVLTGKPSVSFGGVEARLPIAPMTSEEDAPIVEAIQRAVAGPTKH